MQISAGAYLVFSFKNISKTAISDHVLKELDQYSILTIYLRIAS